MMKKITYKKSGVDIKSMDELKNNIKCIAKKSFSRSAIKDIGGFGAFYSLEDMRFKKPVLVSSSDGVGTKLKIAQLINKHDTIGIDLVAMNVNDILCTGAKPLFFLDYISFSKLGKNILLDVVKGINKGCMGSGCSLIGGETAQMPGFYKCGDYDVAGFCVGIVEREKIIDGSKIGVNNTVIGLSSSGLHSNGFSLVRRVFSENELKRMGELLLKPTRIYVKEVLALLNWDEKISRAIKGIAHITGGAFYDKIARILPNDIDCAIEKNSWKLPEVFKLIENKASISEREMYHTFNMGIGMVLIVDNKYASVLIEKLISMKVKAFIIGKTIKGKAKVILR